MMPMWIEETYRIILKLRINPKYIMLLPAGKDGLVICSTLPVDELKAKGFVPLQEFINDARLDERPICDGDKKWYSGE